MMIYLTTARRVGNQITLKSVGNKTLERITVVCPKEEVGKHKDWCEKNLDIMPSFLSEPAGGLRLSDKRQWLLKKCPSDHMLMLDDDLIFATRATSESTKLTPATRDEVDHMIDMLQQWLEASQFTGVGVSPRAGNNRMATYYEVCCRMMCVLGFNVKHLRDNKLRFDLTPVMSDFAIVLQMLERGMPNIITTQFTHDQPGSNTAGGCSAYRTVEMMAQTANTLAARWPGIVTVKTKKTKARWSSFEHERTDVTILWKKLWKMSTGRPTPELHPELWRI